MFLSVFVTYWPAITFSQYSLLIRSAPDIALLKFLSNVIRFFTRNVTGLLRMRRVVLRGLSSMIELCVCDGEILACFVLPRRALNRGVSAGGKFRVS